MRSDSGVVVLWSRLCPYYLPESVRQGSFLFSNSVTLLVCSRAAGPSRPQHERGEEIRVVDHGALDGGGSERNDATWTVLEKRTGFLCAEGH